MADRQDEPQDDALPVTGAFAPIRLPEEWREPGQRAPGPGAPGHRAPSPHDDPHGGPVPGPPRPPGPRERRERREQREQREQRERRGRSRSERGGEPGPAGAGRVPAPREEAAEVSPARIKAAKRRRRAVVFSAFLSTLVLLISGVFWAGLGLFSGNVERIANPETEAAAPDGPLNILIAGVDDVKGLSKRERDLLSLNGERNGNRTDTLMVMRLAPDHKRVTVVSIPRDTWVGIPGQGQNKINSAYGFGGPKMITKVVKRLTGLPINHYVEVNPMGLVKIIDRLGGIDMCVPSTIVDSKINFTLEKGTKRRLGGIAASKFARTRAVGNDFGRMKRQQKVISATLKKVLSSETLTSPAKFTGFVTEAARAVKVDDRLSNNDLIGLADQLKNIDLDQVQFTSLPVANPDYRPHAESEDENLKGISAVQHDAAATKRLFDALRADRPLVETGKEPDSDGGPELKPADVKVRVLNGGGVTGMGAQAGKDVEELGFKVPKKAGDTDPANHKKSFVRYTEGHEEEAKLLAAKIPGAATKLVSKGAPVTLIVGRTYKGPKDDGPPKDIETSTAKDNTRAVDCKKFAS